MKIYQLVAFVYCDPVDLELDDLIEGNQLFASVAGGKAEVLRQVNEHRTDMDLPAVADAELERVEEGDDFPTVYYRHRDEESGVEYRLLETELND
jgi:hypothetical protein